MAAFARYLLVFIFGALVGALAILLTPAFSITVASAPKVAPARPPKAVAVVEKPAPEKVVVEKKEPVPEKVEPTKVAVEEKTPEKPKPVEEVVAKVEEPVKTPMVEAKTDTTVAKVETVAKEEPAPVKETPKPVENRKLDFSALNSRPIFWPASVTVTTATSTPLMEKGQKVADIPLTVGAVLQISKVLGDGALEVRAQGLKFEIDSRLTDFDGAVRKRIAELAEKGSTIPPPFVQPTVPNYVAPASTSPGRITLPPSATATTTTTTSTDTTPAPTPTPAPKPTATNPPPKPRDTLDDKMNSLFGRRVPNGANTDGNK